MAYTFLYECRRCKERFESGTADVGDPHLLVTAAMYGTEANLPAAHRALVPTMQMLHWCNGFERRKVTAGGVGDLVGWRPKV